LDLKNPKTFNEKINWLKLNYRNPICSQLADKYEVRKYVSHRIGEKYLIPNLGVYDNYNEICFENLPNRFALKCTHDSGNVIVCKDKKDFDYMAAKAKINKSLKTNYFIWSREWPYKTINPRIVADQYIEEESGQLTDYKFFCFEGEIKLVQVDYDRFTGHKRHLYTPDWQIIRAAIDFPVDYNRIIAKPKTLDLMLDLASKLSEGFPFIRVDLYSVDDRVYFGELTFFPDGGLGKFNPTEFNYEMGSWINLPVKSV
jgi:hypothetical protein